MLGGGGGGSVANALFHVMKALCNVSPPVASVTFVVIGTCGAACGGHDDRRHHHMYSCWNEEGIMLCYLFM